MKHIIVGLALIIWSFACGGEMALDESPEYQEQDGLVEKVSNSDPAYGSHMNLGTGNGNVRCATMTSSSICQLPLDKTVTVRVTGAGMSAAQKTRYEGFVDNFISLESANIAAKGWSISRVTSGTADVSIFFGSNPGTNTNSINSYADCLPFTGTVTPLDDGTLTGTYQKGKFSCAIDRTSIVNDFLTADEERVERHAVGHVIWHGFGIGGGGAVNRMYGIAVTPGVAKQSGIGNRVGCMLSSATLTGSTYFPICNPDPGVLCPCLSETDN